MVEECVGEVKTAESSLAIVPIPGHENYGATADGFIWSCVRGGEWRKLAGARTDSHMERVECGYLKVKLAGQRQYKVHALVMLAFVGPRPLGMVINHLDGDKGNNALANLEYCTVQENTHHALRSGLVKGVAGWVPKTPTQKRVRLPSPISPGKGLGRCKGERVVTRKLDAYQVREIRDRVQAGGTLRVVGAIYGVSATQVRRIAKREKWASIA